MGLNIKNAEVEAAIRRLARAKRVSLTEAVSQAVRKELEALEPAKPVRTVEEMMAGVEEWRRKYKVGIGSLGSDHNWLYDEDGLPK